MSESLPLGFHFAGVHCGIKRNPIKLDLTLVHAPEGAVAAGVYTQNLVCAAPVLLDRQRTPSAAIKGVVVNSGNANACTGERGWNDAVRMGELMANAIGAEDQQILVMSTGVIGHFLPMEKIAAGIKSAALELRSGDEAFAAASRGILTTDKGPKVTQRTYQIGGRTIRLAGMCKGAGMIGPNMATMLGMMLTDAPLTVEAAQACLREAAEVSFNCISVEGHMSTNDTLLLLASAKAGGEPLSGQDLADFQACLNATCIELAKQIPDDGEGATHLIEIEVIGCRTTKEARQIAQTIANSALVKTAITGGDPNWGRIVSAAGYAGVPFDPAGVDLTVNGHLLYERGAPLPFEAATVSQSIKATRETKLVLRLREGDASIRFWTSDLTVDYVRFNADYTT